MINHARILDAASKGLIVGAGLASFSLFCPLLFPFFGQAAPIASAILLAVGGLLLRNRLWLGAAYTVPLQLIAAGVLWLVSVALAGLGSEPLPPDVILSSATRILLSYFVPYGWLPFLIGMVAGKTCGRNKPRRVKVDGAS